MKKEHGAISGEEEGGADYEVWCDPISKMSHHIKKGVEWGRDWTPEV